MSVNNLVTVEINLYRLPFRYKLYYNKINKKFNAYIKKDENKNINIINNLWNYYVNILSISERKKQCIKLHFSLNLEKDKNIKDITKILRKINCLELEPESKIETINDESLIEYKIEQLTELIIYTNDKNKIIYPNKSIYEYSSDNVPIKINVYEVLNTNGMKIIFKEDNVNNEINTDISLYSYFIKKNQITNLDEFRYYLNYSKEYKLNKNSNKEHILSLNEYMVYFPKEIINKDTKKTRKIITEYIIPIFHYYKSNKDSVYLFRDFYHEKIRQFPNQYIILNNSVNISGKQLYEYIWYLNSLYMNHPNIITNEFWWNKNLIEKNDKINIKNCYPFVLRYTEIPKEREEYHTNLIHCPLCSWHTFCPGCIINPNESLEKLSSSFGIVVDWCTSFVNEEFIEPNFNLSKEISRNIIIENLPSNEKNKQIQNIKDYFNLFLEEKDLVDPLYCQKCQRPEIFTKEYSINKLPYILILSLKTLKRKQVSHYLLKQYIEFPLYDLEINEKKYDLYGVINYNVNTINSEHSGYYTCIIKINNEWKMLDDDKIYSINENEIMNKDAHILFYICKDSPYNQDYYKYILSFLNNENN